jgi:hypothetical protein
VLNIAIWGVIAVFVTVGLAAADAGASTFYAAWAFFAAVLVGGAFFLLGLLSLIPAVRSYADERT